jgi:hypothetical protein
MPASIAVTDLELDIREGDAVVGDEPDRQDSLGLGLRRPGSSTLGGRTRGSRFAESTRRWAVCTPRRIEPIARSQPDRDHLLAEIRDALGCLFQGDRELARDEPRHGLPAAQRLELMP